MEGKDADLIHNSTFETLTLHKQLHIYIHIHHRYPPIQGSSSRPVESLFDTEDRDEVLRDLSTNHVYLSPFLLNESIQPSLSPFCTSLPSVHHRSDHSLRLHRRAQLQSRYITSVSTQRDDTLHFYSAP